jgi:hypothetical protein
VNVRRVNFALLAAAALMTAAGVAALALAVLTPVRLEQPPVSSGANPPATSPRADSAVLAMASFEPVWALELRKPLDGAAAPATAPSTPSPHAGNPTPITLVGTIGDTLVLLQTQGGVIEVKGVGESVAGAKIVSVRPSEVDLESAGRITTLKKPRDPDAR